jgi:alpha-tubulin suppressor-like RCC1 family protein
LGDGTTNDSAVPVTVVVSKNSPLTNAVSVSAGRYHACAVLKDKSVWCWGKGDQGQLGNGDTTLDPSAVAIQSKFTDVKTAGAGVDFTCVLTSAGAVSCVGQDQDGELGNGTASNIPSVTAVTPQGLNTSITSLDVGSYYNCAVGTDSSANTGSVQCWGLNSHGQLGIGNTNDSALPAAVKNLVGVVTVAPGSWHTCAITSGHAVYCWGIGLEGELGIGKASNSAIPQLVTGF